MKAIAIYSSLLSKELNASTDNQGQQVALVQSFARVLADAAASGGDQTAAQVYVDLLAVIRKSYESSVEFEQLVKLNENYLRAMIRETHEWRSLEAQCTCILNNYSSTNELATRTLLEIYVELALVPDTPDQDAYAEMSERVESMLGTGAAGVEFISAEQVECNRTLLASIGMLRARLNQQNVAEFKKNLDISKYNYNAIFAIIFSFVFVFSIAALYS